LISWFFFQQQRKIYIHDLPARSISILIQQAKIPQKQSAETRIILEALKPNESFCKNPKTKTLRKTEKTKQQYSKNIV
jgi:hypothetical protein